MHHHDGSMTDMRAARPRVVCGDSVARLQLRRGTQDATTGQPLPLHMHRHPTGCRVDVHLCGAPAQHKRRALDGREAAKRLRVLPTAVQGCQKGAAGGSIHADGRHVAGDGCHAIPCRHVCSERGRGCHTGEGKGDHLLQGWVGHPMPLQALRQRLALLGVTGTMEPTQVLLRVCPVINTQILPQVGGCRRRLQRRP